MSIRNPVLNADGSIDCEINHPNFGWLPFTAREDDVEQHGREIYALALAMNPPSAPESSSPDPVPQEVSRFQAKEALRQAGLLAQADAIVAASNNPTLQNAWDNANVFSRNSQNINALAPALGLDDAALDDLFRTAAGIVA